MKPTKRSIGSLFWCIPKFMLSIKKKIDRLMRLNLFIINLVIIVFKMKQLEIGNAYERKEKNFSALVILFDGFLSISYSIFQNNVIVFSLSTNFILSTWHNFRCFFFSLYMMVDSDGLLTYTYLIVKYPHLYVRCSNWYSLSHAAKCLQKL